MFIYMYRDALHRQTQKLSEENLIHGTVPGMETVNVLSTANNSHHAGCASLARCRFLKTTLAYLQGT